jgi:hypothetical protein
VPDYLLLMHNDTTAAIADDAWSDYLGRLQSDKCFQGGSAIGDGVCARREGVAPDISRHLSGFIRVSAANLNAARALLAGNPVFEAGGTVQIRELPRTG